MTDLFHPFQSFSADAEKAEICPNLAVTGRLGKSGLVRLYPIVRHQL
jgi:hypothetical protein